jgi:hypothetical protein
MADKQNWSKMIGVRLDEKTLYLLGLASRAKGLDTTTDYVKWALQESFKAIKIEDDQEGYDGKVVPGKTLADLADTLYQSTEAACFVEVAKSAPWLLSDGESKLLRILEHSDYFAPVHKGFHVLHDGRIKQHWTVLAAIRDGEADIDILPADQQPRAELRFGLMDEATRVALYKSDRATYKREHAAYIKAFRKDRK